MNTIDKIKKQIHKGEIKFFGSDVILDKYDIENVNHLTCAIIENYLYEKTSDFYEVSLESVYFRTQDGIYMEIDELIETDEEISSFYYTIEEVDHSIPIPIQIDINIPTFDEGENYEEYIKELFRHIRRKTCETVNSLDIDELFDDLYSPFEEKNPTILLDNLDEAKERLINFSNKLN